MKPAMIVVTVAERKARAVEQLRAASREVMADLRAYASKHRGKFLVFGSTARGELGPDSDFDVVVDFPAALERPARDYAEDVCIRRGIRPDIFLISEASEALLVRVRRDAVVLS
jgi:hypothetical protein